MNHDKVYNFMGVRHIALGVSILMICISFLSFAINGLRFGLDFTGGTLIEVGYDKPVDIEKVRVALDQGGLHGAVVQYFGTEEEVLIRLQRGSSKELGVQVMSLLKKDGEQVELRRIEFVGPQVGDQLKSQGLVAIIIAHIAVMFYLGFRFQSKFSIGAIAATFHDVVITVGCFSLFGWEFDLNVLAAVLAVIGYSMNDTIVVFDRVRENITKMRQSDPLDVINASISQTLSRTFMTSFVTLLTVLALFFLGGELLRGFSVAMILGIVFGTYSSIYIASGILPLLKMTREDMLPSEKEKEMYDTP